MRKTKATSENVTFSNITAPAGFSINPDGTVNVPANALPGDYIFTYTLCPIGSTTGCVNDILVSFTIHNTVRAIADAFNFDTSGTFLGSNHDDPTSFNILTNDGYAVDCGFSAPNSFVGAVLNNNVTLSNINQTELAGYFNITNSGFAFSTSEVIPVGTYNFTYSICDFIYPLACEEINGWITVLPSNLRFPSTKNKEADFNLDKFLIFPNPSKGLFNVSYFNNQKTDVKIEVFSIIGQKIYENVVKDGQNNFVLDLSNFQSGTYLMKATIDDKIIGKMIIKE